MSGPMNSFSSFLTLYITLSCLSSWVSFAACVGSADVSLFISEKNASLCFFMVSTSEKNTGVSSFVRFSGGSPVLAVVSAISMSLVSLSSMNLFMVFLTVSISIMSELDLSAIFSFRFMYSFNSVGRLSGSFCSLLFAFSCLSSSRIISNVSMNDLKREFIKSKTRQKGVKVLLYVLLAWKTMFCILIKCLHAGTLLMGNCWKARKHG